MTESPSEQQKQETAELVRKGMFAKDFASQGLGMAVISVAPGRASMTMTVRESMINGQGSCQGGIIATLADSAFAYACNSYNEMTVAEGFDIDFLSPARLGDVLLAQAHEVSKAGRVGLYDVEVSNQQGKRIAMFRGRSYTLKGKPSVE